MKTGKLTIKLWSNLIILFQVSEVFTRRIITSTLSPQNQSGFSIKPVERLANLAVGLSSAGENRGGNVQMLQGNLNDLNFLLLFIICLWMWLCMNVYWNWQVSIWQRNIIITYLRCVFEIVKRGISHKRGIDV